MTRQTEGEKSTCTSCGITNTHGKHIIRQHKNHTRRSQCAELLQVMNSALHARRTPTTDTCYAINRWKCPPALQHSSTHSTLEVAPVRVRARKAVRAALAAASDFAAVCTLKVVHSQFVCNILCHHLHSAPFPFYLVKVAKRKRAPKNLSGLFKAPRAPPILLACRHTILPVCDQTLDLRQSCQISGIKRRDGGERHRHLLGKADSWPLISLRPRHVNFQRARY